MTETEPDTGATEFYILDDNNQPVPCSDVISWAQNRRHHGRVAKTIIGEVHVSTVFLGIDHRWSGDGPPILFETMVFRGEIGGECERCSTYDEALAMHDRMVARVQATEPTG